MTSRTLKIFLPLISLGFPFAAINASVNGTIADRIDALNHTFFRIISLLLVLATVLFLWGVVRYVISADDKSKEQARQLITWGIIGLAVMVSVWGLAFLLVDYFGVGGQPVPSGPTLP